MVPPPSPYATPDAPTHVPTKVRTASKVDNVPRLRGLIRSADATAAAVRQASGAYPLTASTRPLTIPTWGAGVSLDVAMRVPAFRRGLEVIAGTVATFPLVEYGPNGQTTARALLRQPEPDRVYSATMRDTVSDILCYGRAYWLVLTRDGDGWPRSVRLLPAVECQDVTGGVMFRGEEYRDVIRFGYGRGLLVDGADTLRLALDLEAAAGRYAANPLPAFALKNTGADLPEDTVAELLDAWEESRAHRSTAYLNSSIETETFGWNSAELQLVEARSQSAIEVARLLNLDPVWIGAGVPGSSMTYQNRVDLYRQLIDLSLTPVMAPISQRLGYSRPRWAADIPGYPAVTEETRRVAFDTDRFLQANYADRASQAIALYQAGLISQTEARALIDLTALEAPA